MRNLTNLVSIVTVAVMAACAPVRSVSLTDTVPPIILRGSQVQPIKFKAASAAQEIYDLVTAQCKEGKLSNSVKYTCSEGSAKAFFSLPASEKDGNACIKVSATELYTGSELTGRELEINYCPGGKKGTKDSISLNFEASTTTDSSPLAPLPDYYIGGNLEYECLVVAPLPDYYIGGNLECECLVDNIGTRIQLSPRRTISPWESGCRDEEKVLKEGSGIFARVCYGPKDTQLSREIIGTVLTELGGK